MQQKHQKSLFQGMSDVHNTRTLFEYFSFWRYEYAKNVAVQNHLENKNFATVQKIFQVWLNFAKSSREARLLHEKVELKSSISDC